MQVKLVKQYIISKDVVKAITGLANLSVIMYMESEEDNKPFNILTNETVYTEGQMASVLCFLSLIKLRVQTKRMDLRIALQNEVIPEHSHGIVMRPKEFVEMIDANYAMQIVSIDRIRKFLTEEDTVTNEEDDF